MAITSLDGVISGMRPPENFLKIGSTMEAAGIWHSLIYESGMPGASAAPASALAGDALTTYAGQIPFTNPASGNSYLARLEAAATLSGALMLADRLWHNAGITITTTTGQTINSTAWPARDRDGSTNGENVLVGIEVSTVTGNAGAITNTTLTYTNQAGTGSRTATMASFPIAGVAGTFVPFQLQAGDTGIRSVQTLTLGTSYISGTIHLVAYRILGQLNCPLANVGNGLNAISGGFVRLYNNTVPFLLWLPTAVTAINLNGQMVVSQG